MILKPGPSERHLEYLSACQIKAATLPYRVSRQFCRRDKVTKNTRRRFETKTDRAFASGNRPQSLDEILVRIVLVKSDELDLSGLHECLVGRLDLGRFDRQRLAAKPDRLRHRAESFPGTWRAVKDQIGRHAWLLQN